MFLGCFKGLRIAEEGKFGIAEDLDVFFAFAAAIPGDAGDAVGLAGLLGPEADAGGGEAGAGAVEEEVMGGEGFVAGGIARRDDFQLGETLHEKLVHAVVHAAGPEGDVVFGEVFFEEVEHAGGVGDVSDVHGLPGGAEEDAL